MHVNDFLYIPKFVGDDHAGHRVIQTTQIISYIIHAWMHDVKVSTV